MPKPKPSGFTKWFYKSPILLYRAHLGFLMGKRFLMIEHRGRKTGKLFRTVLEVAGRNPENSEWIASAGYGTESDWYRNLKAEAPRAVWIGSKRFAKPTARFLEPDEAADVIEVYEREHPKAASILFKSMGVSHDGTHKGRVEMVKQIPMVGFGV